MVIDDLGQFRANTDEHGPWRGPCADGTFACWSFVVVERVRLAINDFAVIKHSVGLPVMAIPGENELVFVLTDYRNFLG